VTARAAFGGQRRLGRWLGGNQPRSLTLALFRHTAILLIGASVVLILGRLAPIESQPTAWLLAGLALGLLTALIGSWYGLLFLVSGLLAGAALDLAARFTATAEAAGQLAAAGPSYAAMVVVAIGAFAVARLAGRQFAS
jgi:hypothetical protein